MKNIKDDNMKDQKRYDEFSQRFRQAIVERGWEKKRREDVGKIMGVTGPAVTYWWNGNRLPTIDQAIVIGMQLNCCVEWLLTGRGPMRPLPAADDCLDMSNLTEEEKKIFKALVKTRHDGDRRKHDHKERPANDGEERRKH